jgi:ketosteroid isomerase-like protein
MTKWILRLALLTAMLFGGVWAWHFFFPGPEQLIRKRLMAVARTASTSGAEGALAKASRAQGLSAYFTPDVEITIDLPGQYNQTINGVTELMQLAMAARSMGRSVKVELLDLSVAVAPDKASAEAHLTGQATISGEQTPQVQELKAHLKKVQRDWLIDRVETVRTLR